MRGSVAKRLRRIAASLGLEAETKYAPGGPLRRRGDKGAPIPRPFVLRACERLAYKQAKALYKGKSLEYLAARARAEGARTAKGIPRSNRGLREDLCTKLISPQYHPTKTKALPRREQSLPKQEQAVWRNGYRVLKR